MDKKLSNQYEGIITSLSTVALSRVDGVVPVRPSKRMDKNKSVQVFIGDDNMVDITVSVNIFHDKNASKVAYEIQNGIKTDVENATIYKVKSVNVNVVGVIFTR